MTTYLRHWWTSGNGATRERDLYRRIKGRISSEPQARTALMDLETSSIPYAASFSPDHSFWSSLPDECSQACRVLLTLDLEQYKPLLLAALRFFEMEHIGPLMRALVSWSVRGLIVGGIGGGTTERYYAEAAVGVSQRRLHTAADVYEEIRPLVPRDGEFHDAFSTAGISSGSYGVLRACISRVLSGTATEQYVGDFVRSDNSSILWDATFCVRASNPALYFEDSLQGKDRQIGNFTLVSRRSYDELYSTSLEQTEAY